MGDRESYLATSAPAAGRTFGGRFRALRLLKEGQGIETWLATDLAQPGEVVVKTASTLHVSRGVRQRLEHEVQVLQDLQSPCLAPLLQFGADDELLFLSLPFVPGVSLEQRLAGGPLSVRDALTVADCLLEALRALHECAVLHRDVKPANLIVDPAGPVRKATLIDLGLARSSQLDVSIRDMPVGTVRYMAPEQAGLIEGGVDARSDLYAAGAVLFECLAGRPPFLGPTAGEVLRQHLAVPAPELRGLGITVPGALEAVIARLLRKDPRDRYQSAAAALADVRAITAAIERGVTDPVLAVGSADRRATVTEPAFIGRQADLDTLGRALDLTRQGCGGLVLLEAPSGGGKTWLLNELARRGLAGGAWVLRGRGLDQAAQRPFQVLAGVVGELGAAARSDPALGDELRRRLGDHREVAAAVLPELASALEVRTAGSLGPEAFAEARSLPALASLLDTLGSPMRPAVVLLDDTQWADELTLKLLRHWHRPDGSERHTLVVAAFRSEEVPAGHPLRSLMPAAHLTLAPFGSQEIADLVTSMAGPVPAEAVEVVRRLAEGSPFMAVAVVRGLVESGALVATEQGWRVEPPALADAQSSRHAAALLARRLGLLPGPVRHLLCVGAVLGKEFEPDLAANLAGVPGPEAIAMLEEARQRHIIWADQQGERRVFVHDKLREALLQRLPPEERQRLHRLAAEQLEQLDRHRVFELAYHFDAAGDGVRSLPYALSAAARARAQQSLAVAERQYRIAERGAASAGRDVRRRVAEGLGEVLMLLGRYEEAGKQFVEARALGETAVDQAQLEGKLGELAFKRGDVTAAGAAIERGLHLLGRRVPRSRLAVFLGLAWELLIQLMHTMFPALVARRKLEGADAHRLAVRLYSRLTYAYWFYRGKLPCLWSHLRELNLAERYPPTPELAQAYSEHAPVMTMVPLFRRGEVYVERSLSLRRAQGDTWGQGQSLGFYGIVLYGDSRFPEAIVKLREAIRLLERTGDRWESNTARWHIAYCLYRLGELRGAVDMAREVYQAGQEIGDRHATAISLGVWMKASLGHAPAELVEAELAHSIEDVHTRAELLQAKAIRLLAANDPAAAVPPLEEAWRMIARTGTRQEYVAPVLPWLATALRRELETLPPWNPAKRRRRLRHALSIAKQACRLARSYRNNLPHALRESALLAALSGRPRRARARFDESLAVAKAQGAKYEHAQTRAARAEVGAALGWPAATELPAARQALQELEAPFEPLPHELVQSLTLSLADRFETLLEAGRAITSVISPEAVVTAMREATLQLLRAEQCMVLKVREGSSPPEFIADDAGTGYSATLARQSLASGRPVLFVEGLPQDVSESASLLGVRSALYVPVFAGGKPAACLAVLHRQVGGLFGAVEERLGAYIGALAGAALERAEGFEQVKQVETELRRAGAAKDQFLAMLAHELRNPLAPVLNALHIIRLGTADTRARQWSMDVIDRQIRHMARLVDDLLDVSRISRGKIQLRRERVDLARLVKITVEDHIDSLEKSHLSVTVQLPPGPVWVAGDPTRLAQVLGNLLHNAGKFTDAGGRVMVRLAPSESEQTAVLSVSDTGIGIEPAELPYLFEPFMQADRSLDRSRGGLGLGLALVKGLVQLHGGNVTATSSGVGQGTTFTVRLPLAAGMSEAPAEPTAAGEPARAGLRVLLIEDNPDTAESLRMILQLNGHLTDIALTGPTGLEAARRRRPDVVLCDIGLPGMDGYTIARTLRREYGAAEMLLVAVSGYGQDEDLRRSREAGFDHHLIKPVDPQTLQALLASRRGKRR